MSDDPRPRRPRNTARMWKGVVAIDAALDTQIPPPHPPSLGEDMLLRARQNTMRNDAMDQSLLGRIAERSDANGKALDALNGRLDRIDDKLEGVAYRRDIEQFMTRADIEAKIERAERNAKEEAAKATGELKTEVVGLRRIGWGLASTILLGAVGLLVKVIMAGAHIAT